MYSTHLTRTFLNATRILSGSLRSRVVHSIQPKINLVNGPLVRNVQPLKPNVRYQTNGRGDKRKVVGYWLVTCGGMVFIAVSLGGITRLTKSGLSMVTWKMFGEKLPRTEQQWLEEFNLYKQFPEYKITNKEMTLDEFKWIWYMEYIHRMWGRGIGAVFALPASYFWYRGYLTSKMKRNVLVMGTVILMQGLMGWYMVKSGLEDRFDKPSDVPRVSQYRLASHLTLAFILYSLFARAAMDHLIPAKGCNLTNIRRLAWVCKGSVFLTAVSGAFVAGIEAGLVYNSFPKMADRWIPQDILALTPTYINFFENPTTTQFDHRILGITTVTLISSLYLLTRGKHLPGRGQLATKALLAVAWTQATLGVSTLLMYVPTWLAASHQSGSLVLLSTALWLTHELKRVVK